MRMFLICDNDDTAVGMRLAGIEGIITDSTDKVEQTLSEIAKNNEIGIIFINESLCNLCNEAINSFRKSHSIPLIIEIPDRNSTDSGDSISEYVRQAIGIQM